MLKFSRLCSFCRTGIRTYQTSPDSRRIYGPSPSDIRPILPTPPSNTICLVTKTRRSRWSDESRSRLRKTCKERAEDYPLHKWRIRDPEAFSKMISEVVTKVREKESQARLIELITSSQPRKLELWSPEGRQARYRISLFSGRFFFRIPGELPDPVTETYDGSQSVFVSVSISPTSRHPYSARRSRGPEVSDLNSIGIKVSGKHPVTQDSFDAWAKVGDGILRRILDIAHSFEDQGMFREMCTRRFKLDEVKG